MKLARNLAAAAVLAVAPAATTAAQDACGGGRGIVVPDLGWSDIDCSHCQIEFSPARRRYRFGTEPRLSGIRGPGVGRLRDGDVLVALDGRLITTDQAGDRMANVRRGERVRLTVRRGGQVRNVDVTAGERCLRPPVPPTPPTPPRAPRPPQAPGAPAAPTPPHPPVAGMPGVPPTPPQGPRAPGAPRAPVPPVPPLPPLPPSPPEILPEGWFGFGIRCDECGIRKHGNDVRMFFGEAPTVESVEPGSPAARAGIRRGDRLVAVDGAALTTPAGAQRFQAIRPGQTVTWTYQRGSGTYTARAAAIRRPDVPVAPRAPGSPRTPAVVSQQLRFSGAVGNSDVEVRGAPVTIIRDERTGELVIRSHDLVVRVRPNQR
ncbi:MAG TPA: PDZ domain-containing protein [Longimicrobium sp.]|nr:PDZ domain-containing protein [Longimicrobium sp.]